MKHKAVWVSFVALLFIAIAISSVAADPIVTINRVEVNGVVADQTGGSVTVAGEVSEKIPIEVEFTAADDFNDLDDVRMRVFIEGYRDEISSQTSRFHIVNGSTYVKRFVLELPSSLDLDDLTEELLLYIRVTAKGEDAVEEGYVIKMQKELYSLNILSVEASEHVTAGGTISIDVVIQNNGDDRLDNTYVRASISELGISRRVYAGDLRPVEEETYDDIRDTVNKRVYLNVPRNALPGTYEVEIEAYNYDTITSTLIQVVVDSLESGVLPTVTSRTISTGEEATFDVVLVNPNDRMVLYTITPEESKGLIVEVTAPIVTVPADSSKTVRVKVKATESADEGTHVVKVNVNSETDFVRQVSFTVNVDEEGKEVAESNTVLILTVILSIIFVVLLIVLIVLLTKRPAEEPEEFGETSYY